MNTAENIWRSIESDKTYREAFAISLLKGMIPFQTRVMRRQKGWSQEELARRCYLTQGVISRAEDPDYGNLTLTTIGRIAAGFDLAAIVEFVPFSNLVRFVSTISEAGYSQLLSFEQENARGYPGALLAINLPHAKKKPPAAALAESREWRRERIVAGGSKDDIFDVYGSQGAACIPIAANLIKGGAHEGISDFAG